MIGDFLSPETKAGRLRRALHDLWKEHKHHGNLPTSARFLYYELIARGILSKIKIGKRRTDQDMLDALTDLRERSDPPQIPWDDIVDETRELIQWNVCNTIAEGMREAFDQAKLNIWTPDPPPMILCESRSLRGVLEPIASNYQAPIGSTNGQCAGFLHTRVGPALEPGQVVLYLGDLDFSGGHIERNNRVVLERLVGDLAWERVAINEEQAQEFGIEPILKYDKRDRKQHPAIETEALGQSRIVELLRARLRKLMPAKRRKAVQEREQRERAHLGQELGYEP